ncbi:MAG: hypothetical protein NZO58_01180 [Gemmataceae bacterium]|nr:hypothetical protein [Gemmataceae bacterium]
MTRRLGAALLAGWLGQAALLPAAATVAAETPPAGADKTPTQDFSPPPPVPPTAEELQEIKQKFAKLGKAIAALTFQKVRDPALADVEIYHQAVANILEHGEFYSKDSAAWTLSVLDRGLLRARFLQAGETPWMNSTGHTVVRGYRSRIDGSVQPYAVTLPAAYGKDPLRRWRVDVVLHGRDTTLTEVKFLYTHRGDTPAPANLQHVRIDVFGRGNNAYRWAGEIDVFEAIEAFFANERLALRERLPDGSRIVLRGFSMGGAGTWHIGLHHPDRWCVLGPGAGFTTTHGYVKGLSKPLPPYQEACLRIYDAVDYAANAFNVPIVAYSGEDDPQKLAADLMEERLRQLNITTMTHLVAPGVGHQFPPEWQTKADALWSKYAAQGRPEYPDHVRFTTYTLKYPSCAWVEILGLDKHYHETNIDAQRNENGYVLLTKNVRALHLHLPEGVNHPQIVAIDGQQLTAKPWIHQNGTTHLYLARREGRWQAVLPQRLLTERAQTPQKTAGLQGPIDDAFCDAFVCVRGTAKPYHEATQRYAEGNLKRFAAEWAKYFRGQLPIKDDVDVTAEDIATKHLILFGDPASNYLVAQVLDGLPLRWTAQDIQWAGVKYPAKDHVPVLIYPNPLNANRYVVLNSGHTFHAADFKGTNALLYPRLGDWAVLRLAPTSDDPLGVEVRAAGLYDEYWKIAAK